MRRYILGCFGDTARWVDGGVSHWSALTPHHVLCVSRQKNSREYGHAMTNPLHPLIAAWDAAMAAADQAPQTRRRYRTSLGQFVAWFAAHNREPFDPARLTAIDLIGYRAALQDRQATNSVNVQVAALRAFCRWLHDTNQIEANPATRLRSIARGEPLGPKAIKAPQVNALLRAAQQSRHPTRNYAILQMLIQTGLRVEECATLRLCDITLSERQGHVRVRAGKGNKTRSVPLNRSVRAALTEYLATRWALAPTPTAVAAHLSTLGQTEPLWLSQKRGTLRVRPLAGVVAALVRQCAARGLVPAATSAHTLRHTFATNYLQDHPGDLVGLAALLGHSSLDTTRIYTQPSADELAERVERLGLNAYGA